VLIVVQWIQTAIFLLGSGMAIALFIIASSTVLVLAISLIETLIFGRPRERSVARWLHAPWNDDARESDEGRVEAQPVGSIASLRPDRITAALVGARAGGGNERPVFRGAKRRAQEVARQRGEFLNDNLSRYRNVLPDSEIVEIPPTLIGSYEPRRVS